MSDWISVNEALPEMIGKGTRSKSVLIRRNYGAGGISTTAISFRWSEAMIMHFNFKDEHHLYDCWDGQESKGYIVTHWMPLPEPPETATDE